MALTAAPVFPNLVEESQLGYDVRFNRPGTPLFLQFKLVHQMVYRNANEAIAGDFQPPFYRMHLRPSRISDQHESLLSLEQAGNEVYYASPAFHTTGDLNTAYAQRLVWGRSFKIRPSDIGPLPNEKAHHVTFQQSAGAWKFYSEEASRAGHARTTEAVATSVRSKIADRGNRNLREQIGDLDASMLSIVALRNIQRGERERLNVHELGTGVDPVLRVAYIARQFFDCQMMFATLRADSTKSYR